MYKSDHKWKGSFITDGNYKFTQKHVSPKIMTFKKDFTVSRPVRKAYIYATSIGIYNILLNGKKQSDAFFAPGFTSYKSFLQYQEYDITSDIAETNTLIVNVAGGWAVGSYVMNRQNRITDDRQSLLLDICIEYADGSTETIGSDSDFVVTTDGPYKTADLYDGETYDANVDYCNSSLYHKSSLYTPKVNPEIQKQYGLPVTLHESFEPKFVSEVNGQRIYDFGQNFAGVVTFKADAIGGEVITIRHAELLNPDGTLNTSFLRTAKATLTYTCKQGLNEYTPEFTYMGFRYISVAGIAEDKIAITARAIYSDVRQTGSFECSDENLNRFTKNILWSSKSNFVDIPTDCPQRDERLGWTGDISVFARTACKFFDMTAFLEKWLKDVKAEQLSTGGIPNTVPSQGYGFPATMPKMAIDFWGDACTVVPWELYNATGNTEILAQMYDTMRRYVDACRFWAGFGIGYHRYIWNTPSVFHFGDWVAPDEPKMSGWQKRSKWTATASLAITSGILAKTALILGKDKDAVKYSNLSRKVSQAYRKAFFDDNLKLKNEFQTGYVLPIHFDMLYGEDKQKACANLAELVRKDNYRIGTGFPGTPYILYALCDNGYKKEAFNMLFCQECPSWLYEVKMGATTIWERWDGLTSDGTCPIGDDGTGLMISYNHYASGAIGAFFFERILGIRPVEAGYTKFDINPVIPEQLEYARGEVSTPHGNIKMSWTKKSDCLDIAFTVPAETTCVLKINGRTETYTAGDYRLEGVEYEH